MTDEPLPALDPDQVECPRASCHADVGAPCRAPSGNVARTVHMERRRAAAAGQVKRKQPRRKQGSTPGPSPATDEGRRKGGLVAAQNRRRRQAEAAAAAQAEVDRLEAEKIEEEAKAIAADTVRYTRDRLIVNRQTLDAAQLAGARLVEGLQHLRRPRGFDSNGDPQTVTVEVFHTVKGVKQRVRDEEGELVTEEKLDLTGWYGVSTLEALAKVATATLNALRLEEGKPTGILEKHNTEGPSRTEQILGEHGVAELAAFALQNLPKEGGSS